MERYARKILLLTLAFAFLFLAATLSLSFWVYWKGFSHVQWRDRIRSSGERITVLFSQGDIDALVHHGGDTTKLDVLEKLTVYECRRLGLSRQGISVVEKKRGGGYVRVYQAGMAPGAKGEFQPTSSKHLSFSFSGQGPYSLWIERGSPPSLYPALFNFFLLLTILLVSLSLGLAFWINKGRYAPFTLWDRFFQEKDFSLMAPSSKDPPGFDVAKGVLRDYRQLLDVLCQNRLINGEERAGELMVPLQSSILKVKENQGKVKQGLEEIRFFSQKIASIEEETGKRLKEISYAEEKAKFASLREILEAPISRKAEWDGLLKKMRTTLEESMANLHLVEEVAEESHLLSINASIEAISEEGNKRFSVVASEIRRLAGEVKEAVQKNQGLLEELRHLFDNHGQLYNKLTLNLEDGRSQGVKLQEEMKKRNAFSDEVEANLQENILLSKKEEKSVCRLLELYDMEFAFLQDLEKKTDEVRLFFERLQPSLSAVQNILKQGGQSHEEK